MSKTSSAIVEAMADSDVGSAIGRADLRSKQWEEISRANEQNKPAAWPICRAHLEKAIADRKALERDPKNAVVG